MLNPTTEELINQHREEYRIYFSNLSESEYPEDDSPWLAKANELIDKWGKIERRELLQEPYPSFKHMLIDEVKRLRIMNEYYARLGKRVTDIKNTAGGRYWK